MKQAVSKVRTQRTRNREKNAAKGAARKRPFKEKPIVGFMIAFLLWLFSVSILAIQPVMAGQFSLAAMLPLAGNAAFLLAGLFVVGLFLTIVKPRCLQMNSRILLMAVISLLTAVMAKAVLYMFRNMDAIQPEVVGFLLPFALAPLLITILIDGTAAIAIGLWTTLFMAMLAGNSFALFLAGLVATLVAAQSARKVRTRARVFRTGLIVGLATTTCVLGVTGLQWATTDVTLVLRQAAACLLSGFFSAMVTLLMLPLFETLFRITTDITLLELSDLGHPLLQRLAIEAPGTYHHSLVVANLAQAAADEIGANSLLARVCCYFHDIGKLTKPDFFTENIKSRKNPHDDLPPSMSTLIITSHVKEGMSLAMLHKLPSPITDVIREHHGTGLMTFFHHKARTKAEDADGPTSQGQPNGKAKVDESDFRYDGPKPRTRESGIICLADAVEAASRSMEKTSPGHIEDLVEDITNQKLRDGQLAVCELTLSELTRVKRSFVFTLTNMLHGRVPYPKDEDRDNKKGKPAAARDKAAQSAGAVPDDASVRL